MIFLYFVHFIPSTNWQGCAKSVTSYKPQVLLPCHNEYIMYHRFTHLLTLCDFTRESAQVCTERPERAGHTKLWASSPNMNASVILPLQKTLTWMDAVSLRSTFKYTYITSLKTWSFFLWFHLGQVVAGFCSSNELSVDVSLLTNTH